MFDLLKKKFASFTEKVTGKIQQEEIVAPEEIPGPTRKEKVDAPSHSPSIPASHSDKEETRTLEAKPSIGKRIKGLVSGKVKIEEKDIASKFKCLNTFFHASPLNPSSMRINSGPDV